VSGIDIHTDIDPDIDPDTDIRIVVVGSMNVDIALRATKIPSPGETVRASDVVLGPGGKGLNQAIAAARLGARVHMVGQVGDDRLAPIPLSSLEDAGVDTTFVESCTGLATGTAVIVVEEVGGQNAITVAGGANSLLSPERIRSAGSAFNGAKVLLVQLEAPNESVEAALDLAGEHGITRILDPAPYRALSDELLSRVDVLTPNENEASQLAGMDVVDRDSAAIAGRMLQERTNGDVIVTLAHLGCVWVSAKDVVCLDAPEVESIDSTGAGDAFNGALAFGLAKGETMARALRRAVVAGSVSTLRSGAAASMPTLEDLEPFSISS
jgi:ribokinase